MRARLLKSLALGALIAVALLGITVSASQAANFTASSYPTTLTGESVEGIETEAGSSVENDWFGLSVSFYCKSHFKAFLIGASSTLEAEATFTRCQIGLGAVEMQMTGCKFLYHLTSGSGDQYSGGLDLVCPAGKTVDVNIPAIGCAFALPSQQGMSTVHFVNDTGKGDISIQATSSKPVHYTITKTNPIYCPTGGVPTKTNGTYGQVKPVTLDSLGPQTVDVG